MPFALLTVSQKSIDLALSFESPNMAFRRDVANHQEGQDEFALALVKSYILGEDSKEVSITPSGEK